MAVMHRTTLNPTKLELLAAWLPDQPWFDGDAEQLEQLGAFRFDDPAGEVGVETLLVASAGAVYQVPLTYRGAPLDSAASALIGTMEHGVLGTRWAYDGTADPAYAATLVETIVSGGREAERVLENGGEQTVLENDTRVGGSGVGDGGTTPGAAASEASAFETPRGTVEVIRRPAAGATAPEGAETLTGTWPGQAEPVLLVVLHRA